MANTASAKKRARQAVKARARNAGQRSMIRTTIKKVVKALDANDKAAAVAAYTDMVPVLDRYASDNRETRSLAFVPIGCHIAG